jgi:hypothetical protein
VVERGHALLNQLLGLALVLGERAARPLDVGTRAGVATVEEEHARPHADRAIVFAGKIVIQTREQQFFYLGRSVGPIAAQVVRR